MYVSTYILYDCKGGTSLNAVCTAEERIAHLEDRSKESTWNVFPKGEKSWKMREDKRHGRQILSAVLGDTPENGEEAMF